MKKLQLRIGSAALIGLLAIVALSWSTYRAAAQDGPDPETIELGARLYLENCAVCHGETGQGRVGATLAQDWPSIDPATAIRNTIETGIEGTFMPPWSKANGGPFTEEEIDAVLAYVLSWQTTAPLPASAFPSPTPRPPIQPLPEVEGDPNQGAILFGENCAVCHGENGEGRIGVTLAQAWPSIRPDLAFKTIINGGVEGTFMPPWSQENGGPLTEGQINDVVAFILSLSAEPVEAPVTQAPVAPTPTPEAAPSSGVNTGLILSGTLLVLIIIGGVIWASRARR